MNHYQKEPLYITNIRANIDELVRHLRRQQRSTFGVDIGSHKHKQPKSRRFRTYKNGCAR